jgi:G:T-mismatch repair DNA endonuclease (very short patch repair protein)
MDNKIRKKIISEYKKGKSSLQIVKIIGLSKPTILKVLNDEGLVRKKDRCKSLNIKQDERGYYVVRTCPKCKKDIRTYSKKKTIACRNHFNKLKGSLLCKPCSLKLQVGEGNPFYGKKHTKNTIKKISESRKNKYTGNQNHMKKEFYRKMSKNIMDSNWKNEILNREKMSEQLRQTRREGKIKSGITSKKEKEIILFLKSIGIESFQSHRVDTKICDIYIPSFNLIIEYFGDYWHCNPKKYSQNYFNEKKNMTAKEIWDYDNKKIDLIKNYGYNLEVIWESELKDDNKLINKIVEKYVKSK